jgi:hypothetical protein
VDYAGSAAVHSLPLAHAVDRIEALGRHAAVVGSDDRYLHFTSVRLGGVPTAAHRYTRADAAQGEMRSHGFFYRAQNEHNGLLGLPIVASQVPGVRHLYKESAALLFLRNEDLALSELGMLDAKPQAADAKDGCRASCVDWYGNSRPLFIRGRVFALMGYEIVEGKVDAKQIIETQRVNFAPGASGNAY